MRDRSITAAALGWLAAAGLSVVARAADPSELVQGVSAIVAPGSPGAIHPMSTAWWGIAGGDEDASFPSLFVAAREYGAGRVLVCGHDGLLTNTTLLDNPTFLLNTFRWLDTVDTGQLAYTSGHAEWATGGALDGLAGLVATGGMSLTELTSPITLPKLESVSALIVGNAWEAFTEAEIEAVRIWVAGGGGLCLVGLGWSWEGYHPGQTMDEYPMMRLAAPYEIRWLAAGIGDPTDQYQGAPVFSVFYPQVYGSTVSEALGVLQATHAQHGAAIPTLLESDPAFRLQFVRAHQTLAIPGAAFPDDHPERQAVYDGYLGLVQAHSVFYGRGFAFDEAQRPTSAWVRERAWRSWCDALPLTAQRKAEIAAAGWLSLTPGRLAVFNDFDMVLMDNDRMGPAEVQLIHDTMTLTPPELHDLRAISVRDYLGEPPLPIDLSGRPGGVNIFALNIGEWLENPFPPDVPAYNADVFFTVVAHELNHVVDAVAIQRDPVLRARKAALIADAGEEPMNYLRSMIGQGFFVENPQEFFASIANQWCNHSERTLQLGLVRFDAGRPDPINQALLFAEVYSRGGGVSSFYLTDADGHIQRREVAIERDAAGWITALIDAQTRYDFELDTEGRVQGYEISAACPADLNADGVLNTIDFLGFLAMYSSGDPIADWNADGVINTQDFLAYLNDFAAGC